jgi:uncharacterized protein YbbC (DUF1343 family)
VGDSVDRATGVHIYSIYGDTPASRHPSESMLRKLDVLVIDIQDIGSRSIHTSPPWVTHLNRQRSPAPRWLCSIGRTL